MKTNNGGKWLSNYITDKYAGILTEEDVAVLFSLLAKELGENRSEAARQCGLTGKATYDWENAAYVKLGTKKKVLEASLKKNFLGTVEYLFGRSTDSNLDLLRTILSTLYANALEASSVEEFKSTFAKFEITRTRNLGMIRDGIQTEVTDMTTLLRDRAAELGIPTETKSIKEFSAEEMLHAVQIIGHVYSENPIQAETFAEKDVGLPTDALKPIIETFKNLCFTRNIQTNATDEVKKDSTAAAHHRKDAFDWPLPPSCSTG
jgi:hypothetical protein